jgi:Zn-finger nucleic acid-binding protein
MNIIAHRGYWIDPKEKNKLIAFERAIANGFGVETDFRDYQGRLVISHDVPVNNFEDPLDLISAFSASNLNLPLAINIKSDGLHSLIDAFLNESGISNYFVFDMTIPDMKKYLDLNILTLTRLSEYEDIPVLLDRCNGVWLDAFKSEWYDLKLVESIIEKNKKLVLVSSELHNRDYERQWGFIKNNNLHKSELISLCTDFPKQAQDFFNVEN